MSFTDVAPISALGLYAVPEKHGIYVLYERGELIYIGRASGERVTLRSRLLSHNSGAEGPCTQRATHFSYMITANAADAEVQTLQWFKGQFGRLPRCNERIG